MRERILAIVRKEFLQVFREPRLRLMLVGPPVIQLIVFGFAVNLDLDNARIGWFDRDRTPESRALRAAFDGSPVFEIAAEPETEAEAAALLDHNRVLAVVSVMPGFARDRARGAPAAVQVLVDGTNSNNAALVSSYASRIIAGPAPEFAEPRVWFNPELKSRYFFIPGVVMNIITIITLMLTAMAIVREKEIGTMEQLLVTPIRPAELILGKTLPFLLVGLFDLFLVTALGQAIFGVPFRGSIWTIVAGALAFLMTTLGAGLFISTVSRTQQQAMMSSFLFFMPSFMLSGFAFPVRNMPEPAQWIAAFNPQRYFVEILRGVFLKGSALDILWPQFAALVLLGGLILAGSVARFRSKLD